MHIFENWKKTKIENYTGLVVKTSYIFCCNFNQILYGNSIESSQKKRKIIFQKIGAADTAQCRNRQIQQLGAVAAECKIPLNKNKKNDYIH
jgi:hypothetical protein